ncbi:hypothetical protein EJ08DRAFT_694199 [Tothia fuscella]|uniref:Uncharacterized protein n=1 Tax=Tothia fuscella TaxID=1048955 RepID=A0A9P4U0L9_9PEZI|nr:hypothetical protein EJ08DRAFT_694199 [Tothia fuscella]
MAELSNTAGGSAQSGRSLSYNTRIGRAPRLDSERFNGSRSTPGCQARTTPKPVTIFDSTSCTGVRNIIYAYVLKPTYCSRYPQLQAFPEILQTCRSIYREGRDMYLHNYPGRVSITFTSIRARRTVRFKHDCTNNFSRYIPSTWPATDTQRYTKDHLSDFYFPSIRRYGIITFNICIDVSDVCKIFDTYSWQEWSQLIGETLQQLCDFFTKHNDIEQTIFVQFRLIGNPPLNRHQVANTGAFHPRTWFDSEEDFVAAIVAVLTPFALINQRNPFTHLPNCLGANVSYFGDDIPGDAAVVLGHTVAEDKKKRKRLREEFSKSQAQESQVQKQRLGEESEAVTLEATPNREGPDQTLELDSKPDQDVSNENKMDGKPRDNWMDDSDEEGCRLSDVEEQYYRAVFDIFCQLNAE